MRILAYGGTGYYERLRLGEWGEIARAALEDTLGMPGEQMIYGVGLTSHQPFVVLRQRQTIEGGRSYAFSLLIDPGEKIWERFRWNAAEFIHVLLEAPEKEQIFAAPENFGTQSWQELFDRLEPVTNLPPLGNTVFADVKDNLTALWLGTAFTNETVSFSLSGYDIENRPQPLEIAAFQATLPICFRNGSGWLVGAGATNARSLGAQLTLEDTGTEPQDSALELISLGNRIRYAWETLFDRHQEFPVSEELERKPLWSWTTEGTSSAANRMVFLSDILTASGAEATEFIHRLNEQEDNADFLQGEIRQSLYNLLINKAEKLNPIETEYLLRQKVDFNEKLLAKLDETTLIEFFKRENFAPDDPQMPPCSPKVRGEIWLFRLKTAKDSDLPNEFERATNDLKNNGSLETWRANIETEIANRIKQPDYDLLYWRDISSVAGMLEKIVLANVERKNNWVKEYLMFADDAGGNKLFGKYSFPQTEFSLFINRLIDLAEMPGFEEKALKWLNDAANFSVRKYISLQQKKQISKLIKENIPEAENQWKNFDLLGALFRNDSEIITISPAPSSEQPFLINELWQLNDGSYGSSKRLPNLEKLCDLLDSREAELNDIFSVAMINQERSGGIENWINGWRRINQKKAAAQTIAFLIETNEKIVGDWIFYALDNQSIASLFKILLFDDSFQRDELYRRRVVELLSHTEQKRLKKIIQEVFNTYFNKRKQVFASRFGFDEKSLNLLFSLFPERNTLTSLSRHEVFTGLAGLNLDKFADEACRVFEAIIQNGELLSEKVNDYRKIVLVAIKKNKFNIQSQIKRRLNQSAQRNFDRILAEVGKLQSADFDVRNEEEATESVELKKGEKKSFRIQDLLPKLWNHIRFVFGQSEDDGEEGVKNDDKK